MKYLVIATNPTSGTIEYNIVENKDKIPSYIKLNYARLIEKCNYSWKELRRYILIFEIEPSYELLELEIQKPVSFEISIKPWKYGE